MVPILSPLGELLFFSIAVLFGVVKITQLSNNIRRRRTDMGRHAHGNGVHKCDECGHSKTLHYNPWATRELESGKCTALRYRWFRKPVPCTCPEFKQRRRLFSV